MTYKELGKGDWFYKYADRTIVYIKISTTFAIVVYNMLNPSEIGCDEIMSFDDEVEFCTHFVVDAEDANKFKACWEEDSIYIDIVDSTYSIRVFSGDDRYIQGDIVTTLEGKRLEIFRDCFRVNFPEALRL